MILKSAIISIILIFLLNCGYGQSGEYIYQNFPANYHLNLLPNNEFKYDENWGTVQIIGKGYYILNEDSLYLNFEEFEIPDQQAVSKKKSNLKNTIELNINAIDFETRTELKNLYLSYVDADGKYSQTQELKNGEIEIERVKLPLSIKIWGYGYSTSYLDINEYGQFNVETSLKKSVVIENYKVKTGNYVYKIYEIKKDKISLYFEFDEFPSEFKIIKNKTLSNNREERN